EPLDAGYLAAWPCGEERPKASHVNYGAGEVRPNGVLVGIGTNGQVCVFTLAATHMVVDVTAFVAGEPPAPPTTTTTTTTTTAPATTVTPTSTTTTTTVPATTTT